MTKIQKMNDGELFKVAQHLYGILGRASEIRVLTPGEFDVWFILDLFFLKPYVLVNASELRKALLKYYE